MFVVSATPSYTTPVTIGVRDENGEVENRVMTARYKRLTQEQIDDLNARVSRGEMTDQQVLDEVLIGWGADVVDANRTPLDFTPANLKAVLAIHPTRPSLVKRFFETIQFAPTKNL